MDETEDAEVGWSWGEKGEVRTAPIVESYELLGVEDSSAVIVVDVTALYATRASWRIVRRTKNRYM